MPNGVRVNFFEEKRGSRRAVDMLLAKLADKPYTTEYPMPAFDRVAPNPAVKDLSKATIALVTSGGIVRKEIQIISNLQTLLTMVSTISQELWI